MCRVREVEESHGAMDGDDVWKINLIRSKLHIPKFITRVYPRTENVTFIRIWGLNERAPCVRKCIEMWVVWKTSSKERWDQTEISMKRWKKITHSLTRTHAQAPKKACEIFNKHGRNEEWIYSHRLSAHFSMENFIKNEIVLIVYPSLFMFTIYMWACGRWRTHVCVW